MDDIAVIGIGLRFPGNATSPEELWKVLERGESQWSEFPKDRLNIDGYFHPGGDRQGSISFRGAHFIKGDFAAFDAPFFSVAAEDAKAIDPQQRILLEASYEALENAGIRKEDIDGSDAAVYVGSFVKDYEQICLRDPDWQPQYAATGNGIAIMANRISYFFNLHGPSMTIDTGCSGSLVSVHLAAQSLRSGESSLAIAAGAGMILTPNTIMPMTALNFLSPDGKCFTFDSRANGYGRGEGIGVVILKRLSDAIRDNDTIRAVIRGTNVNQDGHTTGITLPSKEAQVANIRSVYKSAGLDFNQTAYVECHGTGTQAGDWRELKAISESLGSGRAVDSPIVVGSVKPNIGHLEGAAGVAGLIKGVLTLEHGKIPPNINFEKGNSDIDFEAWRVKVPREMLDWPLPGLRRVSVNCFGFGGTNAHVIMDEAPEYMSSRGLKGNHNSFEANGPCNYDPSASTDQTDLEAQLFLFSSHEKAGVRRLINSHVPYLDSMPAGFTDRTQFFRDYSYTLGSRRSNLEWKHAIIAKSPEDLTKQLRVANEAEFSRTSKGKPPKICFVFTGQGAQYAQMGKTLLSFAVFHDTLKSASVYMKEVLKSPFDLFEEIMTDENDSSICFPEIAQPAITALQIALVDLLKSFGISPKIVVGHSSGEVAAAFSSGAISRETAWEISYQRGQAAILIPQKDPDLESGMIAVGLSLKEADAYLKVRYMKLEIACINSPRLVTLSGSADEIHRVELDLHVKEIFCRRIAVTTAYHSSHMKLVEDDYLNSIANTTTADSPMTATIISSVTGAPVEKADLDKHYWVKNMISPVQYVDAIQCMMDLPVEERPDMIIEVSPVAALRWSTLDILSATGLPNLPTYQSVLDRTPDGAVSLLRVVADLWARGYPVNMEKVVERVSCQTPPKCLADLPPYPWNHTKSYWHESHLGRANRFREFPRQDLIGAPTADAISFEPRWRGFLRVSENPWLQDHQVQKTIVYPAAGMVTMALEGATQLTKDKSKLLGYEITNMRIDKAMIIPTTAHGLETAMNFKQTSSSSRYFDFTIYSKQLDGPWEQHANGSLQVRYKDHDWAASFRQHETEFKSLKKICTDPVVPRQLYELLDIVGMNYGTLFQNISEIYKGNKACISKVRIPDTKAKMPAKFEYPHLIHPATLDSMFQSLFAIDNEPMVPTFIRSVFISAEISRETSREFTGYSTASRTGIRDANANIAMTQSDWHQPSVVIDGLHFTGLSGSSQGTRGFLPNHRNLCTEIVWAEDVASATPQTLAEWVKLLAHKYSGLCILQFGGDSLLAKEILGMLLPESSQTPYLSRYTVAKDGDYQVGASEVLSHVKGTPLEPFVEARSVDGSDSFPDYHLIVVGNNTTPNVSGLRKHLKDGGVLLEQAHSLSKDFATHWPGREAEMEKKMLRKTQLKLVPNSASSSDVVILVPTNSTRLGIGLRDKLKRSMRLNFGLGATIIHEDLVLDQISSIKGKVLISLLDFSEDRPCPFVFNWMEMNFIVFRAIQKAARGILWVTQGAHMKPIRPMGSSMVALARTLMSEDPLKPIVTFDLGVDTYYISPPITKAIIDALTKAFAHNQGSSPRELEYAEENEKIFIPRLIPINALNQLVEDGGSADVRIQAFHKENECLKLQAIKSGLVDYGLLFSRFCGTAPNPGEIEIIFTSTVISHIDLETVMGRSVESEIGLDICGHVSRVGSNVSGFVPGEGVAALISDGAVRSKATVDARLVRRWPSHLPLSQCTSAYHSLSRVGRLGPGKSVLIHAGASSHGLSAIAVASQLGADIYATVMGPGIREQRELLQEAGFELGHILEADSDSFVNAVKRLTGGTIIQFANKSPCPPMIRISSGSVSLVNFDFAQLLKDDPEYVAELLDGITELLKASESRSLFMNVKAATIGLSRIHEAFQHIDKNPYTGLFKICGDLNSHPMVKVAASKCTRPLHDAIFEDKTYLLAGGLGGLGRSICELLVKNGARHVAFLSRSGASSEESRCFIADLRNRGIDARVFQVDICDMYSLRKINDQLVQEMPPVAGVFQCAAVIKDVIFDNMSHSDWETATMPKIMGSANLMEVIPRPNEDPFFIFLASSAGVIGNRGQANYAAGNFFEDSLARKYRLEGKHAVSIDLGPVLGAGMLANDEEILDMLRASGFYGIRHQDFLTMVSHAITMEIEDGVAMPPQVIMGIGTGGLIRQNEPADPYWSRTALYGYLNLIDMPPPDLGSVTSSVKADMKSMLTCCTDSNSAAEIICTGLSHMLAKAMNMLPEEIDTGKPPNVYGVDSLVAVGVRNWVLSSCGVVVSVFEVLSDATITELAATIAEKGGFGVGKD
ncbi:Lovastatin diketide synthase LovF [Neonectria ditissima]|uniref:Lovastatin diketide synthase LovF n=1 Tax=Neonectria ditissima TaxID=78410 RepID=A0A0P7AZT0_9HYPO|nr:Lovastatin diketide synthase LovF [Neonectria ditissima]